MTDRTFYEIKILGIASGKVYTYAEKFDTKEQAKRKISTLKRVDKANGFAGQYKYEINKAYEE